eukprot:8066340-Pyramimonas_sp.AAC.1
MEGEGGRRGIGGTWKGRYRSTLKENSEIACLMRSRLSLKRRRCLRTTSNLSANDPALSESDA